MPSLVLDVALPADRVQAIYQGYANRIQAISRDGRRVSIPAHHFRPFLTHQGIYGTFELQFSEEGTLLDLRQLP